MASGLPTAAGLPFWIVRTLSIHPEPQRPRCRRYELDVTKPKMWQFFETVYDDAYSLVDNSRSEEPRYFYFLCKKINEIIQEVTTLAKRKIQIIEKSWHYFSFFQVCFMYAKLYITLSSFLPSSPSCFPQNSMCSNGTKKCRLDLLNTVLKTFKLKVPKMSRLK